MCRGHCRPPMPPPIPICILFFCILAPITVFGGELDCDFREECCWAGDTGWTIREKHSLNINEFRRTFLVGRSRNPPAGNYLFRESVGVQGQYLSCPICSSDGVVLTHFRHWESPTARLHLCYKLSNQSTTRECQMTTASKQSQLVSYLFRVPKFQKIQLVLLAESTEASGKSTVMIDGIKVQYQDCHNSTSTVIPPRPKKKQHFVQPANSAPEEASDKRKKQLSDAVSKKFLHQASRGKMHISKAKEITPKNAAVRAVVPPRALPAAVSATTPTTIPPAPTPQRPPLIIPTAGKDFNPLNDLLGEPLANFLDPEYVTNDKDEPEDEDSTENEDLVPTKKPQHSATHTVTHMPTHISTTPLPSTTPHIVIPRKPVRVDKPGLLSELHRPIPLGVPTICSTVGGCLFENGFCSWKAPEDVPTSAQFKLARVGQSNFLQAKVPSGEVSIIQVDTTLKENHTIVFDALEWQTGSRLIGCCFVNANLQCPFATPNEQGALLWQLSKFECPTGTDKILFICENFGQEVAVCGVDNVRLHKSTDIFFIEPCQKHLLTSL